MLIGLSGNKFSGKDTAFIHIREILEENGIKAVRFAFADPVKEFSRRYFGVDPQAVGADKEKTRYILQGVGEMFRNEVSPRYWIDQTHVAILRHLEKENITPVITDVRYRNEVGFVYDNGGTMLRISRAGNYDSHPSETQLTDGDFPEGMVIDNNSSYEIFRERIRQWVTTTLL